MALAQLDWIGGGGMSETSLWTNPSPNSNFAGQSVTVSDISGYEYLKIKYKSNTSSSNEFYSIISVSDFISYGGSSGSYEMVPVLGGNYNNVTYERLFTYTNNTTILFSDSNQYRYTVAGNNTLIPLEILGLK